MLYKLTLSYFKSLILNHYGYNNSGASNNIDSKEIKACMHGCKPDTYIENNNAAYYASYMLSH